MSLKPISPQAARDLMSHGAILIDIRATNEYAREHIAAARHVPMEDLKSAAPLDAAAGVIFHCRSGNRTRVSAQTLSACAACEAYVLDGGLDAWKKAGLPVVTDTSQPMELQRQVQITAGSLILLGAVLGATVSPWFHALSAAIGAGLVFAGLSGFCGMARLLMRMPWNRKALAG
ncbi:rhodanese family protein [Pusillimonas noertemannii]|uniref:rhodanese family protein n=1 Tax=Pusillimonas noertemannii TaxID=305977 RepID=UPI0002D3D55F|nr:rhodanese family protein [Pusillimonas noertemannii]